MDDLFAVEWLSPRLARIRDVTSTACYLTIGERRACLIDTGVGIGNVRAFIESLLGGLPYFVLLTHGHVDHAGGAGLFGDVEVLMHPADTELAREHATDEMRLGYVAHCAGRLGCELPRGPLAPRFDAARAGELADGDVFDLGGLTLEVIHVSGHTPGMCMVLAREERTLLFGDACGETVLLLEDYCSTVAEYAAALGRVRMRAGEFDRALRNHGTCESDPALLDEVLRLCEEVLAGADDAAPAEGLVMTASDARLARARDPGTRRRLDGGHGNLAYRLSRIR